MPDSVTLLHISDMQFGRNHRFGRLGLPGTDAKFDTLFRRLTDDLVTLRDGEFKLNPHVLVVSGDLAEWGLKKEFHDASEFVEKLTEFLKLPDRSRVVIVPGNHDINRKHCLAYFARCDAEEEIPKPPFWDKWKPFVEMFKQFYGDVAARPGVAEISFKPDQPWTLFEIPELQIVVAGLNSTISELHFAAKHADGSPNAEFAVWQAKMASNCDLSKFGHFGRVGESQLRWFKECLQKYEARGWLRIGVLHHNVIRDAVCDEEHLVDRDDLQRELGGLLNVLMHGHTHKARLETLGTKVPIFSTGSAALRPGQRPEEIPNQYQILRLSANRVERWTRCYDPGDRRWIADVRLSEEGNRWHTCHDFVFASASTTFPAVEPPTVTSAMEHEADVPRVSTGFSGRAAKASTLPGYASDFYTEPTPGLLDQIEGSLRDNGLTFLYGPPGSGKSLTASVVANKSTSAYRFWVNAESELTLIDTLAAAQRQLLNLKPDDKDDVKSFAQGFLEALPTLADWLLIYDNAADLKLVEGWLPKTADKRPILLTSQADPGMALAGRQIARHELDELEERAAQLFFLRRAGGLNASQTLTDASPDDLHALVRLFADLGRLPLALEAAAHVCSKGVSIRDYHTELTRTQQPKLWGDEVTTATRHPGLHRSLTVLFDRIKSQSPEAFEILLDAAWLEPDRIPTWLLPHDGTRSLLTLASDRLLIPVDGSQLDSSGNNLRRMHREHQYHLRGMLGVEARHERLEKLVARLQLPDDLDYALWRTVRATGRRFEGALPAIARLSEWATILRFPSETRARLQHAQGELHFDSGDYPAAEHQFRDALGKLQSANTVLFAALQEQLAVVLMMDYRTKDALQLVDDSLERLRDLQQTGHPSYASSLNSKAYALWQRAEKGDVNGALALHDEALVITENAKGKSHPSYARTLNSKAHALLRRGQKGDIEAALALLDEDLSITELSLGKSHPNYASSLNSKAHALMSRGAKGDINGALDLLDEALTIKEASQGKSHPSYGGSLNSKAVALLKRGEKGDIEVALALLDEDLSIKEASQGKSHPGYANTLNSKADALSRRGAKGDIDAALNLLDEALAINETSQGKSHPSYAVPLNSKARTLLHRGEKGDIDTALTLFAEALNISEASQGKRHPNYASLLDSMAAALLTRLETGDIDAALAMFDEAAQIKEVSQGNGHPNYAASLHEKARALIGRGTNDDIQEAIEAIDKVLKIYESTLGKTHREYAVSLTVKAGAHMQRNQGADLRRGVELLDEAIRILAETRGERHFDTANALFQRGIAKARQGKAKRSKEGLADMDEAIGIIDEMFPNGHPILVGHLRMRASLRRALGQPKGAEADAKRAAEV